MFSLIRYKSLDGPSPDMPGATEMEKSLFTTGYYGEKVEIPASNRSVRFDRPNHAALEPFDLPFKVWLTIYKMNMAGEPVTSPKLVRIFSGLYRPKKVVDAIRLLGEDAWGFLESRYAPAPHGGSSYQHFVNRYHVSDARVTYEKILMPRENPDERVQFVQGLLAQV
jgi:hypothetical protein